MDTRAHIPLPDGTKGSPRAHNRTYPGRPDQVGEARAFLAGVLDGCPVAGDAILLCSELCANAVTHSRSNKPGGTFTLSAEITGGSSVRVQVTDQGGRWQPPDARTDGRGHGLDIVRTLADDWGRHGDAATGWTVWFRLRWPAEAARPVPAPLRLPLPKVRPYPVIRVKPGSL
jgi:anti-sigma regulatory factor (Ser/Thr protein kinase)